MLIYLSNPNDDWPLAFARERDRLKPALANLALHIEHIGSTSVPGLVAKPVIDIQVGVTSLDEFDTENGKGILEGMGYQHLDRFETMVPFRRLFVREIDGVRQNNLHLVAADHPWFRRHLVFRDYLRESSPARIRYQEVKQELAQREWNDVNDYAQAKSDVIIAIEEQAFTFYGLPEETRAWLRSSRV